jgi:hypothetical protein
MFQYIICKTNEELIDWQKDNKDVTIAQISPMVVGLDMGDPSLKVTTGVGVFVTYYLKPE